MVNQREPPKAPPSPARSNDQINNPHSHPEFGRPSLVGPSQSKANVPFNIPKANRPRPEHHRSDQSIPSLSKTGSTSGNTNPTSGYVPTAPRPSSKPMDPFQPVKPSAYTSYRSSSQGLDDDDFVEIARPSNVTWTTKAAPTPLFSSNAVPPPKFSSQSKNLRNFVDLTTNDIGFATNARQFEESSTADSFSYLDAAKANENIKSLLEGAFEDEEDKPRTRARKAKIESKIDDLAKQLEGTTVGKGDQEDGEAEEEEEEVDDGTVEGLKVKLLSHQIEGVEWMRAKESRTKKTRGTLPKGGILADDMGLGKTVQAIALMLTNPRPDDEEEEEGESEKKKKEKEKRKLPDGVGKGTLVVAPLALIKQWESEIDTKVADTHRFRVCVYHGAQRAKYAGDLNKYDIVITTYGTLNSEHGQNTKDGKESGCFAVHWYRILLDEAHTIKNRNAKSTKAACALESEYRWCLTGTPLQNNMDELQSLIKFLRIKPYDDLTAWKEQITRPLNNGRGALAIRRLQVYLKAFMKRRTKDVLKLDNNLNPNSTDESGKSSKPSNGFQITKREVIKVSAKFTKSEREFYKRLEKRTDRSLEQMMGGEKLNYASALVLLLRLRQACNHPDLVKSDLAQDKDVLLNSANQSSSAKKEDIDGVADLFGGLSVVTKRCDVCQIELNKKEARDGAIRCVECEVDLKTQVVGLEPIDKKSKKKKKKKKSKHASSSRDLEGSQKDRSRRNRRVVIDSADEDEDEEGGEWIAPEDERSVTDLGKAGGADDEDAEGKGEWLNSDDDRTGSDEEDGEDDDDDETEDDEDESDDEDADSSTKPIARELLASTKIRHLMDVLNNEAHDFKFIVFSFFTSMLDKIEPFLKRDKIGFVRYDGAMRNDLREASLNKLRNSRGTRVLLCSLRAGSLGLNLTAASRVVILEPFWNPFVEEQAIDRVHRLNQTIDVKIYKVTVKDTVEERILDLQERKRELANATIEGKTAAGKLTMKDMMALFGHDAESRYTGDGDDRELDMVGTGRTRLLDSRTDGDDGAVEVVGTRSSSSSITSGGHGERVRERVGAGSKRAEDPVYGRRW